MSRILIYDLEVTDLDADWGTTICIGYKFLDDLTPTVLSITDFKGWKKDFLDDSKLWKAFMKVFNEAEMTIGYYNSGFDRPYMYAKLLKHGITIPANIPNVDLFYTVKSNMKLRRKSMDNVTRYLDMQDEDVHKSIVGGEMWQRARIGDEKGIGYVVEHCRADILLTERLYLRLRPLVRMHPRIAGWTPCRHCGSTKLQSRGLALYVNKNPRTRVQCQSCGGWDTRSDQHLEESGIA